MKFSIVMPVLNGARFIGSAIESVQNQSHDDWELIIMDGGSDDRTIDIVQNFAAGDSRLSFFSGRDQGMYDAVLSGFEKASGAWLAWLNSDDLYTPWAFETTSKFIETGNHDWVTGHPACWDSCARLRYVRPSAYFPQKLIRRGWFHQELLGCLQQESIFFSKELFDKISVTDIGRLRAMQYAGDFLLWRLLAEHAPLDSIPSVLAGFRRHDKNMSALQNEAYIDEIKQTQPFTVPRPIASLLAVPYRAYSSWVALRSAAAADGQLTHEIKGSEQS